MTFEWVAAFLGAQLCDEDCVRRSLKRHRTGWQVPGRLHWASRGMTRRGLYNFLKLVADEKWGLPGRRPVEAIWMRNTLAYEFGLGLGVRFPREWADTDRARVRSCLAALGPQLAIDKNTRRRITRWSR